MHELVLKFMHIFNVNSNAICSEREFLTQKLLTRKTLCVDSYNEFETFVFNFEFDAAWFRRFFRLNELKQIEMR